MKKFILGLLAILVLLSSLVLVSCDQQAIDDAVNGLVDTGAQALGPFFEQIDSTDVSSGNLDTNPDIQE